MTGDEEANIPLQDQTEHNIHRRIFNEADLDGDGLITLNELKEMMKRNSFRDKPPPPSLVTRIHQMCDTNHDGQLHYDEFVHMINNPKLKHIFGRYLTKYVNFVVPRSNLGAGEDTIDGAYEYEYSCCPPRLGMIIISIIELLFFFIDEYKEENSTNFASGPMAQIFIYVPSKRQEIWRFFTYMFVHIGYMHLTVNLAVQICFGIPLEMVHGWWRVLLIYFAGVVAGSLGTSITDPSVKLAGASGGVYSLMTAHFATIILNWKEMTVPGLQLLIFLFIGIVDVGNAVYNRYWGELDKKIGYMAHLAGAVAGLLVGISVLRNLKITQKENILWWVAAIVYVVLMLIGICWNIFYDDYFPKII